MDSSEFTPAQLYTSVTTWPFDCTEFLQVSAMHEKNNGRFPSADEP